MVLYQIENTFLDYPTFLYKFVNEKNMNLSLTVQTSSSVSTPLSSSQDSNCNSVLVKMEDIPEEPERKVDMHNIRIKAWKLCKNYLTGIWKQIKADDIILTEIW